MAAGVVDALEVVDVEQRDRHRPPAALGALHFLVHQRHHVAAVVEAGEFVADGKLAVVLQRLLQVVPVLAQLVAHGAQLAGEHRDGGQHHRDHHEMQRLFGDRETLGPAQVAADHGHPQQQHGQHAQAPHLPGLEGEHAAHQRDGHREQARAAHRPADQVGGDGREHAEDALRHGECGVGGGEAFIPAAADDGIEGQHAQQRERRPGQRVVRFDQARPHAEGADERQQHVDQHHQQGLRGAQALPCLAAEHEGGKLGGKGGAHARISARGGAA